MSRAGWCNGLIPSGETRELSSFCDRIQASCGYLGGYIMRGFDNRLVSELSCTIFKSPQLTNLDSAN